MTYEVKIHDRETGESRICTVGGEWGDNSFVLWTDGEYGCDCVRHVFFQEAANQPVEDQPCGTARYAVIYAKLPDDRVFAIDPAHVN